MTAPAAPKKGEGCFGAFRRLVGLIFLIAGLLAAAAMVIAAMQVGS